MGMTWEAICRRAGGRRHYNTWRRDLAFMRRGDVLKQWRASRGAPGWQAKAAVALGVHRSTITRDVEALRAEMRQGSPCPMCGHASHDWQRRSGDDGL